MGAIELTALLWREREALQAVLERQQELIEALRSADRQAVDRALSALQDVADRLRPAVLMRDIEVSAVAEEWGVPPGLTVADLPLSAPAPPWSDIFADHLRALLALAARSAAHGREIEVLLSSRGIPAEVRLPVSPAMYADPGGLA